MKLAEISLLLLLQLCLSAKAMSPSETLSSSKLSSRLLAEERPCGSIIGRTTRAEILTVVDIAIEVLLSLGNLEAARPAAQAVLNNAARYDVLAVKVCGSCAESDALSQTGTQNGPTEFPYYPSYCGSDVNGYDATQSALVLLPIDNQTNTIPVGKIRSFVHNHEQSYDAQEGAPSSTWPSDTASLLAQQSSEQIYQGFVSRFLDGIMPATRGSMTVYPDFTGFGSSTQNRSDFLQTPYLQAGVQSWLAGSRYVESYTNSCSVVDDTLVVSGKSEGAYGAVPLSWAFAAMGLRINTLYLSAPILDLQVQTKFMIDSYDQDLVSMDGSSGNYNFQKSLPAIAFAASIDTPGYANTGTSETLLDSNWTDPSNSPDGNVIDWFKNPGGELPTVLPFPATQVLDSALLERFRTSTSDDPCSAEDDDAYPGTSSLCEMIRQSSVLGLLNESGTLENGKYAFSTSVCFSNNDTFVTKKNVPDYIFEESHIFNNQILLGGLLEVSGDHDDALLYCAASVAFFYATDSASEDDGPSVISPLAESDQARCAPPTSDDDDDDDNGQDDDDDDDDNDSNNTSGALWGKNSMFVWVWAVFMSLVFTVSMG